MSEKYIPGQIFGRREWGKRILRATPGFVVGIAASAAAAIATTKKLPSDGGVAISGGAFATSFAALRGEKDPKGFVVSAVSGAVSGAIVARGLAEISKYDIKIERKVTPAH